MFILPNVPCVPGALGTTKWPLEELTQSRKEEQDQQEMQLGNT